MKKFSMKGLKFKPAYISERQCGIKWDKTVKRKGVYFIKENGRLVYIGMSQSCIYKALYRHFQRWNTYQKVVTYKDLLSINEYEVAVFMTDEHDIPSLEKDLIIINNPRDNSLKYEAYTRDIDYGSIKRYTYVDNPF